MILDHFMHNLRSRLIKNLVISPNEIYAFYLSFKYLKYAIKYNYPLIIQKKLCLMNILMILMINIYGMMMMMRYFENETI